MPPSDANDRVVAVVPVLRWLSALGILSCLVVLINPAPWSVFGFMVAGQLLVAIPALAAAALVVHRHVLRSRPPREP